MRSPRWLPWLAVASLAFVVCPLSAGERSEDDQLTLDQARGLHKQAQIALNSNRPGEAISLLLEARAMLDPPADRGFVIRSAKIAVWLGVVYATIGDAEEAAAWYETGRAEAAGKGYDKTVADALIGLADLRSKADDPAGAAELLASAEASAALLRDDVRLGKIRFLRGEALLRHGDLAEALETFFEAADDLAYIIETGADERRQDAGPAHEQGPGEEVRYYAASRARVGEVLGRLGYPGLGAREIAAVLDHPETFHAQDGTRWLAAAAMLHADAGELDEAAAFAEAAAAAYDLHGPAGDEGMVRAATAVVRWRAGDDPAACAELDAAAALAGEAGQVADRRELHRLASECHLRFGALQDAFAAAGWAKALADASEPADRWRAWWALARARRALDRDDAAAAYLEALDGLDAQVRELRLDALALGLAGSAYGIYDEAADVLVAEGRAEAALTALERGRSRLLLAAVLGMEPTGAIPEDALPAAAEWPELPASARPGRLVRGSATLRGLRDGTWDPEATAAEAGLRPAGVDVEAVFRQTFTPSHRRMIGVDALDIAVIRTRLPAGVAVLSYRVGEAGTDLFVTTRGGTRRVPLRLGRDGVDDLVREYLRTLSPTHTAPGDPAALRPLAVRAWSELFAPAAPLLGDAAVLVVVPDASLYRLPFGALHDGERYLVERYELATAPSINVLDVLLQRPRRPRASFLGVADPLDNLPAARDEVAHAGSGWPSARILEGSAATPEAVVAALPDADVVHLAAHGQLLSRTAPSYLELAGGDGMRPLDSDAILQLRMQASLVTLSACKSARGGHTGGEALVNSLARSFLAAGAATVVGSLWDVDDQGTAELMRVFYDALPDRSVAGALAHAQRSLAAESHPWFWAGFTAVGDPR